MLIGLRKLTRSMRSLRKFAAFTLAEVLITLGIIGVIAAMSLPFLIYGVQKHVAETKLRRFYSEMNQVFRLSASQTDVGVDGWVIRGKEYNQAELDEFVDTYLRPCMNISYTKNLTPNPRTCNSRCPRILIVLNSGMAFSMYIDGNGVDIFLHTNPEKTDFMSTRESFAFQMTKKDTNNVYYSVDSMEPYTAFWDGKESTLKTDTRRGCNRLSSSNKQYCTKLIQLNNWRIPWDYPW